MGEQEIRALLERVRSGETAPEEAARLLSRTAYEDLGYAKVDHHRAARQGAAEVIFGQGKTAEQIEGIVRSMMGRGAENIIVTRLSEEKEALLRGKVPYRYSAQARLAVANPAERPLTGDVAVVSAGTRRSARKPPSPPRLWAAGSTGSTTPGWPGSIGCWVPCRCWSRPGASWPWRAWRERCPAWWAVWSAAR